MTRRLIRCVLWIGLLLFVALAADLEAHEQHPQKPRATVGADPSAPAADSAPGPADRLADVLCQVQTGHLWIIVALLLFFLADLVLVLMIRRRSESALKESVAQVNLLLNSAAEGIYGLDLDGNCTFCNPACLKLLGYTDEGELLGKNLHQLTHHTRADGSLYPAEECQICHSYLHDSEVHLENEVLWRKDGTCFPVEYWSYPLYRGSKTVGAVVSFLDITERKHAEQKLRTVNQELDAFVYTVSHDLRTPISAVVGYVDLLQESHGHEFSAEALQILQTIEEQGEKMALIVDDLLALATSGSVEPPGQPIDTEKVVRFVITELAGEIERSGIGVTVEPLPPVQVPESLLIQLFENLIGNALRYAGPHGGPIEVGGTRQGRQVSYFVRDHGMGVPPEEREKIFKTFYRGSSGRQRTGTGVGLATVQKICHLYGGHASAEETPGGGATFRVELADADALKPS